MTAAVDAELSGRRRGALERHLAGCAACRDAMRRSRRLDEILGMLSAEAPLPPTLEQDTLRRVRIAAAAEAERPARSGWRAWLGVPVAAAAAVLAVAVVMSRTPPAVAPGPAATTPAPAAAPRAPSQIARATPKAVREPASQAPAAAPTASAEAPRPADPGRRPALPSEPPPELAAAPDLFMDLNILSNMDKLQHYEAIQTTTLQDQADEQPHG